MKLAHANPGLTYAALIRAANLRERLGGYSTDEHLPGSRYLPGHRASYDSRIGGTCPTRTAVLPSGHSPS